MAATRVRTRGFDYSHWQGTPSVRKLVDRYDLDFVVVKCTEGDRYNDPTFATNFRRAGKARLRGAYHFARPEQSSGASQAKRFLARAKPKPGDIVALDLEASDLGQHSTNAWARDFLVTCARRAQHCTRWVYLGSAYCTNGTGAGLAGFAHVLWFPRYWTMNPTSTWPATFDPRYPAGDTTGFGAPDVHQWTAAFQTFTGPFDANVSPLSVAELAGVPAVQGRPPVQEDDMPLPQRVHAWSDWTPLAAGRRKSIRLPHESYDTGGHHAKRGYSTVLGSAQYNGQLSLRVHGLPKGMQLQVRMIETDPRNHYKISKRHPIDELIGTGGTTLRVTGIAGHVDKHQHLWVQTIAPAALPPGAEVHVDVDLVYWRT